jgi:hypothetical protein
VAAGVAVKTSSPANQSIQHLMFAMSSVLPRAMEPSTTGHRPQVALNEVGEAIPCRIRTTGPGSSVTHLVSKQNSLHA